MIISKVKPRVPGSIVRDTNGTILPQEGELIPMSTYWRRRLKDGDIVLVEDTIIDDKSSKGDNSLSELMSVKQKKKINTGGIK